MRAGRANSLTQTTSSAGDAKKPLRVRQVLRAPVQGSQEISQAYTRGTRRSCHVGKALALSLAAGQWWLRVRHRSSLAQLPQRMHTGSAFLKAAANCAQRPQQTLQLVGPHVRLTHSASATTHQLQRISYKVPPT
jgi:hypothetical protein